MRVTEFIAWKKCEPALREGFPIDVFAIDDQKMSSAAKR